MCQWVQENCISRLYISLVQFSSDGTAKTKLAILAFLYCGAFVKNSSTLGENCALAGVVSFTDPPVLTWHRPIYFSYLAVVSGTLP